MSDIKYTAEQTAVIEIRGKNVLVSAAAGSGKTAVLTARIVDLICDPVNPRSIDEMLIVTFTDAAAGEMRERIGKAIREMAVKNPGNKHLQIQQTLVHSALITTVHSFCLYLIRNHFERIGLDPSFAVASSETAELLLEEALEESMEKMLNNDPEHFDLLQERFIEAFSDESLKDVLKRMMKIAESQPFVDDYLDTLRDTLQSFDADPEKNPAVNFMYEYESRLLADYVKEVDLLIAKARKLDIPEYIPALESDQAFFRLLLSKSTLTKRHECIKINKFKTLPKVSEEKAEAKKQMADDRQKFVKDRVSALQKKFHRLPLADLLRFDQNNKDLFFSLLDLLEEFCHTFREKKREKNVIDFSDMEHFALGILYEKKDGMRVPSEVAKAYQSHFKEVMVDEYQDSNFIQEYLLSAVSNITDEAGDRFMVGDVKQSIYRFRLARPEIFREKYDTYSEDQTARDVRIDLSKNFRSRKEVLDSVNCVFEDAMGRAVGEIDYNDKAKLYLGAGFYPEVEEEKNRTELLLCSKKDFENSDYKNSTEWEAVATGNRIREMIEEGFWVTDKKKDENGKDVFFLRPVRYSDITILVRAVKNRASYIKNVLENMGIPTMVLSKEGYFKTPEIRFVMNYIAILDNPRQDVPLLGVLHSHFGGFTEDDLALIRAERYSELLYESLLHYAKAGEDEKLKDKISAFLEKLSGYRTLSKKKNVYEILTILMEKEGVWEYYAAMRFGEQRIANLKILLKRAMDFGQGGYAGLSDFVRFVDTMKNRNMDLGEANISDEKSNVVRIYTMHKSKGLEFPVCFVLGLGNGLSNPREENGRKIGLDPSWGIGMDYVEPESRIKHPSFLLQAMKLRDKSEQRGEDLRLLYVAMTRAKEKLVLVGKIGENESELQALTEAFGGRRKFCVTELLEMKNYLGIILKEAVWNPDYFKIFLCKPPVDKDENDFETRRLLIKEELLHTQKGEAFKSYVYPHESLQNVFTKTSVSDLKDLAFDEDEEPVHNLFKTEENVTPKKYKPYIPKFMSEEEDTLRGAQYGTAHHRVLELLDFTIFPAVDGRTDDEVLSEFRKDLVKNYFISKEDDALVKNETVLRFMKDGLAKRMRAAQMAGTLRREQPFVLSLPANHINPAFPKEEKVLVQGVMDAYFEEEDGLVLVDYKTESGVDEEELRERFLVQLKYYAQALEKLENKKVKEVLIYSFHLGKTVEVWI